MVSRTSYRRWFLRDLPQTYVVFGCTAIIFGVLIYFGDWSLVQRQTAVRQQLTNGNVEKRYTGSIIMPVRGTHCWEAQFDNRTERMIDRGYVNCAEATHQLAEKSMPEGMDAVRLHAVGKAFRHEND